MDHWWIADRAGIGVLPDRRRLLLLIVTVPIFYTSTRGQFPNPSVGPYTDGPTHMSAPTKWVLVFTFAFGVVVSGVLASLKLHHDADVPRIVIWAWERPEDLRFLSSHEVAVAYLAGSVFLDAQPVVRPRAQPLKVANTTAVIAVVRLELTPATPTVFDDRYREQIVRDIVHLAAVPVTGLQIDFDALASQHQFYRDLLLDLRHQLPGSLPLSITALGSWCAGDDWLSGLPISEAVPMMFRMGPDRDAIAESFAPGNDFHEPLCQTSIGVSTDEPWPVTLRGRRVYVFSPKPWNEHGFSVVKMRLQP